MKSRLKSRRAREGTENLNNLDLIDPTDPTITQAQYGAGGGQIILPPPSGNFVGDINGVTGSVSFTTSSGEITITLSGTTIDFTINGISYLKISGLGAMATKAQASNPGALSLTANAAYVQSDFQAVIDKLNAFINSLATAQHTA